MVPNPRKVARALRATVAVLAALGALTLVECGSGGGPDDAGVARDGGAQRSSALGGGTITSGGGGLSRVIVGSAFTGSGTSGAPLELAGVNCSGSAVSAIDANGSATCISAGGGGSTAVFADSPLAGSGSSGSHLTWMPTLDSSIAGTGSSGNSLKANDSVTSPIAGTGSSGSPLTWTPTLASSLAGTGSAGSPLGTVSSVVQSRVTGTASAGESITGINSDGTVTQAFRVPAPDVKFEIYSDLLNAAAGEAWLNSGTSGTGAANTALSASSSNAGHPGVIDTTTGTTTTGRSAMTSSAAGFEFDSAGTSTFRFMFQIPTLSNGTDEFAVDAGWINSATAKGQTAGLYVEYDRATTSSAALRCASTANSVTTIHTMDGVTTDDLGATTCNSTMTAATWYVVEIDINSSNSVVQYKFGTTTSGLVLCCTINTHIPTGAATAQKAGIGWAILKSAGTTARDMWVDYVLAFSTGLAR